MKQFILIIIFFAGGLVMYSQTLVTSNKDGTPNDRFIPDTNAVIQTYSLSSKKITSLNTAKEVTIICTPVQTIIEPKLEPIKVSSEKLPNKQ
jgi:hypothetical protein